MLVLRADPMMFISAYATAARRTSCFMHEHFHWGTLQRVGWLRAGSSRTTITIMLRHLLQCWEGVKYSSKWWEHSANTHVKSIVSSFGQLLCSITIQLNLLHLSLFTANHSICSTSLLMTSDSSLLFYS